MRSGRDAGLEMGCRNDVLVIGGGAAVLTAARDLARRGCGMLLFKARDRLGGRTWGKRFVGTEPLTEMGGIGFDEGTQFNIAREIERYSPRAVLSPASKHVLP